MSSQIKFYEKSLIDQDFEGTTITITDATATNTGQDFVDFMRNRSNDTAWLTTDSDDAANTQIDIDLGGDRPFNRILIVGHNLKAFTIQYYNGSTYVDFSTAISETTNTKDTNEFTFDSVTIQLIRIIITGTQTADEDKQINQLIITNSIGQLEGWPQVKKPRTSLNKKSVKFLSGKLLPIRQRGFFSCQLTVPLYNIDADMAIIEAIYFSFEGVLVWINAGDDSQFSRTNIGFRSTDIYLMLPTDEYTPEHYKGLYSSGIKFKMDLSEVVR